MSSELTEALGVWSERIVYMTGRTDNDAEPALA
jgi:hypothetical protein